MPACLDLLCSSQHPKDEEPACVLPSSCCSQYLLQFTLLPAGYYAEQVQGWEAFADDIRHVCHLWQAAAKRQNSPFAEQLRAKGVPEMGDIILASLESLMAQSEASLNSGGTLMVLPFQISSHDAPHLSRLPSC